MARLIFPLRPPLLPGVNFDWDSSKSESDKIIHNFTVISIFCWCWPLSGLYSFVCLASAACARRFTCFTCMFPNLYVNRSVSDTGAAFNGPDSRLILLWFNDARFNMFLWPLPQIISAHRNMHIIFSQLLRRFSSIFICFYYYLRQTLSNVSPSLCRFLSQCVYFQVMRFMEPSLFLGADIERSRM